MKIDDCLTLGQSDFVGAVLWVHTELETTRFERLDHSRAIFLSDEDIDIARGPESWFVVQRLANLSPFEHRVGLVRRLADPIHFLAEMLLEKIGGDRLVVERAESFALVRIGFLQQIGLPQNLVPERCQAIGPQKLEKD